MSINLIYETFMRRFPKIFSNDFHIGQIKLLIRTNHYKCTKRDNV